jgi:hypothetical protein
MEIGKMSQQELFEVAVMALLKHRDMTTDEIYEAWGEFWKMCIGGISAQMVVDGKASLEWKDNKLYLCAIKEGLCQK